MARNLENTCSVSGCENPCWREVCKACGRKIRYGALPEQFGVTHNPKCAVPGCEEPRYTSKGPHCRGHYGVKLEGRDPSTKRSKRKNGTPAPICSEQECEEPAASKGKCVTHRRHEINPLQRNECQADGCSKRVTREYCAEHLNQMRQHGFTWIGPRPTERIRQIRESRRGECHVPHCTNKTSSEVSPLCRTHQGDRSRKGLEADEYLELLSRPNCESCGVPNPTATDHDHSCPHPRDGMCRKCIRGRLCNGCNSALGYALESPERLRSLAEYIERFK